MAAVAENETGITTAHRQWSWRPLLIFWAGFLTLLGAGAGTLQVLGPPRVAPPLAPAATHEVAAPVHAVAPAVAHAPAAPAAPVAPPAPRGAGAAIAAADPDLAEPSSQFPGAILPKIGADGRKPWQVYAAGWDRADRSPRVAVLLSGMGLAGADDTEAMRLPGMISFGLSPYASRPDRLAAAARTAGHEVLLGIPMEPQGYPLNDPGPLALLTGQQLSVNDARLEQVLGLLAGYAGITNSIGAMRGERYSGSEAMNDVLRNAAARGLMYLDARPDAPPPAVPGLPARVADLVLDQPPVGREIDLQLAKLADLARQRGSALGVASAPTPVTVLRLAEWANSLARQGVVLVPVSALMKETK